MGRQKDTAIGFLIVFGVVFVALQKLWSIWNGGFVILLLVIVVLFVLLHQRSKAKTIKTFFQHSALEALKDPRTPSYQKEKIKKLMTINPRMATALRDIQIMAESMDIALRSKNKETATSRYELSVIKFDEIRSAYIDLFDTETFNRIKDFMSDNSRAFHTKIYTNPAKAHIEKTKKLKTIKAKSKYINLAKELLNEGLGDPNSNKSEIQLLMNEVSALADELSG